MNKFFSFLMVGMAFTALQVSTAEAGEMECVNAGTPSQVADCWKAKAQDGSMKHGQNQHDGSNGQYDTAHQGQQQGPDCANAGTPMEVGKCWEAKHSGPQGGHHPAGAPGMTGGQHHDGAKGEHHDDGKGTMATQNFSGEHVEKGGHHDGPPMDPRSGQPFTQADEAKFQRFADECEATRGLLSEGSTQELVKEGFTRVQVEDLCKMSADNGPDNGPTFKDCKSIKPKGNVDMMRDKKNCFRDVAESLGAKGAKAGFGKCRSIKPRGEFSLMKEKKNCFRDVAKSLR